MHTLFVDAQAYDFKAFPEAAFVSDAERVGNADVATFVQAAELRHAAVPSPVSCSTVLQHQRGRHNN